MPNNFSTRKVIMDLAVTLDGYIEGPKGEVDWCIMEPDMDFEGFLNSIDTILYGRKSYELWGQYTPEAGASNAESRIWELVHSKRKYVFSRTLNEVDSRAVLIKENLQDEINKLKSQPGKDIWLYGGASLITTFVNQGLVDEYRLSIHPVVLGSGKPLFAGICDRVGLKLVATKSFNSGVVQLVYQPGQR